MDPLRAREELNLFVDTLPDSVFLPLRDKGVDPSLLTTEITSSHEFVIRETGNICEGVLRILNGEESPANLVAFIEKDERIEENNRPKIPTLAYEIQTKIFDLVLPIFKQAGMPVKEGRVMPVPAAQPVLSPPLSGALTSPAYTEAVAGRSAGSVSTTPGLATSATSFSKGDTIPSSVPPLKKGDGVRAPLDERHLRALVRIAAGTNYSEERLREAFEDLPLGLQQAITSVDTANAVQDIAKKFLLHVDQMAALASESGLVLLGLTHPRDFVKNLAARLRMSDTQALPIAREISAQVLGKVREALRGLHENVKPRLPITNDQLPTAQEPPKKLETPAMPVEGKVQPFRSETPYSPEAKWNLETAQDIHDRGEKLNREELLRSIEKPAPVQPTTGNRQPTTATTPIPPLIRRRTDPPWEEKGGGGLPPAPKPPAPPPPIAPQKVRPASEPAFPPRPPKPREESEDFISQKLNAPVSLPREEKRYTIDPYRESPE